MTPNRLLSNAKLLVTVLLLSLWCGGSAWAQSPQGTLTGTLIDAQGASIPGVEVTALQIGTNQKFTAVTSGDGTYTIPALPTGEYEVTAAANGFSTYKQTNVNLEVGQRRGLDIQLTVGAVTDTVTVVGDAANVQTEDSSLGETFEQKRIENLPLNGRHVVDLVKLIPGVQPRNKSEDGFAEVDNQTLSQLSFNGGPIYGNQIFLDGGANTVPVHNEISVVPLLDTVEEFKVLTNTLPAEFGQSNGGVINIVTRSGTNDFHGSLYEFVRNDAFDARNAFLTTPNPVTGKFKTLLRFNQYGGTLGGQSICRALAKADRDSTTAKTKPFSTSGMSNGSIGNRTSIARLFRRRPSEAAISATRATVWVA